MRRVRSVLAVCLALVGPSLWRGAAAETPEPVAPSPSASSPASSAPPMRKKPVSEDEIEVITLDGDPEYDRQRFAVGLHSGLGWLTTRGSGAGNAVADFGLLGEFGLGTYGARVPWTLEVFAAFAITRSSFSGDSTNHPNRFTEAGARIVLRGDGLLANRWLSLGGGIVFTSHGGATGRDAEISPGGLVDVGFGVYEWITRLVRYGFAARVPIELSSHPGVGAIGFFYAQVGLGG